MRAGPVALLKDVVKEILQDELMNTGTEEAKLCVSFAQALTKKLQEPTSNDTRFATWLMETLLEPIGDAPTNKKLWPEFHEIRCTSEFATAWEGYIEKLDLTNNPISYQHVTLKYFETLIHNKMKSIAKDGSIPAEETNITLTYEEENAIRYMSGYVIRKLKCGPTDFLVRKNKAEIAEVESSEWIALIDRGGLVHVTDECFQLFLSMEGVIRRHLENTKVKNFSEVFKKMEKIINSDDSVLFDWLMITGDEEEHKEILGQIIKHWVAIRGHSFAKSVLEQYKQATKKSTTKSKGLRTQLFTDQL